MRTLRWLADYWYVPLLAVGTAVAWVLWNQFSGEPKLPPLDTIEKEVESIKIKRKVREKQLTKGAEEAKRYVRARHAETLRRLDAEQDAKVKELEHDPVALSRYLDKLG